MPIKVLLADESNVMRGAIVQLLKDDARVALVGEANTFAKLMQMTADFKPEILLMELHLPEKRDFTPIFVKSQLGSLPVIAISVSNDAEAMDLAVSYGARVLLDKMSLYGELVPAILKFARNAPHAAADLGMPLPNAS
jgi:two-component system response regulator NreC